MKVYLPSLATGFAVGTSPADQFRQLSVTSSHLVCEDADKADLILFTDAHVVGDWRYSTLRKHPYWADFSDKCAVYDERDLPWAVAPGAYVSMPARGFYPDSQRSVGYYKVPAPRQGEGRDRDLLFSLMASPTNRSREPLFALRSPRSEVVRVDGFTFFDAESQGFEARKAKFGELLERSIFVLCPRGTGTSSIRMYEALASGCIPVVISDDWVPPGKIDWDSAILRWPEGTTSGLAEFIGRAEDRADDMRAAGAEIYRRHFAPDIAFDRIVAAASDALASGRRAPHRLRQRSYIDCGRNAAYFSVRNRAVRVRDRLRTSQ